MKFRIVFWDVLPYKIIVELYFTRQYISEDNSEFYKCVPIFSNFIRIFIVVAVIIWTEGWYGSGGAC
jgi:hypothetical protein